MKDRFIIVNLLFIFKQLCDFSLVKNDYFMANLKQHSLRNAVSSKMSKDVVG